MVIIRFSDAETERKALGWLAGRFSFKSWAAGETLVAEQTLGHLAAEGFRFSVEGTPNYEQTISALRNAPATAVQ